MLIPRPKADPTGIVSNPLYLRYIKEMVGNTAEAPTNDEDLPAYIQQLERLSKTVHDDPAMLDKYHLSLSSNYKSIRHLPTSNIHISLEDKYLYWRANPWLAAWDLIGDESLKHMQAANAPEFKEFTPKQKKFMRDFMDPRRTKLAIRCNRGGAKTNIIAICIALLEWFVPKEKVTINSGSMEQSQAMYRFFKTAVSSGILKRMVVGTPLRTKTQFLHGGVVEALAASDTQSRSKRPDTLIYDEAVLVNQHNIFDALGGVWTSQDLKIVFSSTPNKMNHMFYRIQQGCCDIDDKDPAKDYLSKSGYHVHHWTCYDCPWIPERNIKEAEEAYDRNMFRIEMLGEFGSASGTVFDAETIALAIRDSMPEILMKDPKAVLKELAFGVDWGFSHPGVVTVGGVDEKGVLHIIYSISRKGLAREWIDKYIPNLAGKYDPYVMYLDAENAGENKDLADKLPDIGTRRISFAKYKGRMISALRSRLEKGTIVIYRGIGDNDKCLEQLYAYEWMENEEGIVTEKPEKGNDDSVDSLMLCVFALRPDYVDIDDETGDKKSESLSTDGLFGNQSFEDKFNIYERKGWL